jgi:hypothetical protein
VDGSEQVCALDPARFHCGGDFLLAILFWFAAHMGILSIDLYVDYVWIAADRAVFNIGLS